jgi:ethanolamine ammonia-lyase large subunit
MDKLHGLTMGLDVCATFHMGIAPAALRRLTTQVADRAAPAYLMAVAGNADPMLGYLTTSFRDHPSIRQRVGRQVTTAMQRRLIALDAVAHDGSPRPGAETVARLYAVYMRGNGERRSIATLEDEGRRLLFELQSRGFDVGGAEPAAADARLDAIYTNARAALYAALDDAVISDAASNAVRVRTLSTSRDEYLAQPTTGERLRDDDARAVARLRSGRPTQVQFVVSDGLNAHAVNEQLRAVLPRVRAELTAAGCHISESDIVVRNGRVRAGYEIGGLVAADVIIHLIGERPGTGLNTLSAYLTYGRDEAGRLRWHPRLDHSLTTAICGVHPKGKPPQSAAAEIVQVVRRALEQKRSGVSLRMGVS